MKSENEKLRTKKKKKFIRLNNVTPLDFYKKNVGVDLTKKVCLINAPMSNKKMYELYTVNYLGNVVGGQIIKYANVEIDDMKKAAIKSIKNNEAVWFGCDVGKMFHRDLGVMDMDLYDYELLCRRGLLQISGAPWLGNWILLI